MKGKIGFPYISTYSLTLSLSHTLSLTPRLYGLLRALVSLIRDAHSSLSTAFYRHLRTFLLFTQNVPDSDTQIIVLIYFSWSSTIIIHSTSISRLLNNEVFYVGGVVSLTPNLPIWRTRIFLFVWVITCDLSVMRGPTSSYGTAGVALRVI